MLRDSLFSLISTTVRLLSGLVLFIVMAHTWGPRRFGIFMYPFAIAAILVKLVDYGFTLQLMRDIGKAPKDGISIMGRALAAKLLLVVPLGVLAVVIGATFSHGGSYGILFGLLLCDALANSFALFLNTPLRALGRFDSEAGIVVAANLTLFVVVTGIVLLGFGPVVAAGGFVVVRTGYFLVSWVVCRRALGDQLRPRWELRGSLLTLKEGFPFAVHATIGTLVIYVDTILVQHYLGAEAVGIYQAGMRVLIGGLLLADSLNNVYLAALARVLTHFVDMDRLGTRMTRHLLVIGLVAFLCTIGGSTWLVRLIFSRGYEELVPLLPLFGLLLFIRYGGVSYGTLLTLADKQLLRVAAVIAMLILSFVANVVLIPRFGLTGAIWAAIISNIGLYGVYIGAVRKDYRSFLVDWRSKALLVIAGIAFLFLFLPTETSDLRRLQMTVPLVLATFILGVTETEWKALSKRLLGIPGVSSGRA